MLIEGDVKLQLRNRFIHVGVDTSRYALLIGDGVLTPLVLVKLSYGTRVQSISGLGIFV